MFTATVTYFIWCKVTCCCSPVIAGVSAIGRQTCSLATKSYTFTPSKRTTILPNLKPVLSVLICPHYLRGSISFSLTVILMLLFSQGLSTVKATLKFIAYWWRLWCRPLISLDKGITLNSEN